jgi:8-oxo-dGTP pyrophosphatase MutT (NUDIX family)
MSFSRTCRETLGRLQGLGTPAATVTVLRDSPRGMEALLLRKAMSQRFGGLWVFPGGKIETVDQTFHADDGSVDVLATAANAAVRETAEETGLKLSTSSLTLFSHWMPPAAEAKRRGRAYSTFFFCGRLANDEATARSEDDAGDVRVDGSEITRHLWLRPAAALERHASGELGLLPPTLLTLDLLGRHGDGGADAALEALRGAEPMEYEVRSAAFDDGRMAFLLPGDAGWQASDPHAPGARLRVLASRRPASSGEERERHTKDALGPAVLTLERT